MKSILFILLFCSFKVIAQKESKFYFIFNDSELSSNDIKRKINFLIENSNSKKLSFELLHYTNKTEQSETWITNKKSVFYKPTKITCDFNYCDKVSTIISLTQSSKSKLFVSGKTVDCEMGIETVSLANKDESTIIDKINEEVERIKNLKSSQTIYFFFNSSVKNEKPTLRFDPEILTIKETENLTLNPIITGNIASYEWSPSVGLSCTNCKNPTLNINESKDYTLTVKDSSGCNSLSSNVQIKLEKSCICGKELSKVEIAFGKLPIKKYELKNPNKKAEWEWQIISNQSGEYVFDLITNSGCSKNYRLKVLRHNGGIIYDELYKKEQVDKRSKLPLHTSYPDNFVFRVNLSQEEVHKYIDEAENEPFFIIEITSIDENGNECLDKKYTSPKLRFTKCV